MTSHRERVPSLNPRCFAATAFARSRKGTKQAVQDPCSPARIGDGAVAWHSDVIGGQLARGLLETLAADDARRELLHIEERQGELRQPVSFQIEIELPQIVVAPGGQDDRLQRLCPVQEQPQRFREAGGGIDVLLGDAGELATEAGEARKSHRPDERLKLGPLRFGAIDQQQHGADFDRLFFPAEYAFLPTGRLDVDHDDATLAGEDCFALTSSTADTRFFLLPSSFILTYPTLGGYMSRLLKCGCFACF